jgi:predicted RecA/RadA family phage recombinase
MANEATLLWETERPLPFTCTDGTGIEKGALLKLTDPMTAIIHSGDEDAFAGICAVEKIASDGRTKVSVYRGGVFKMTSSAAITIGQAVALSATVNKVKPADASCVGAKIVGIALSTASGADETVIVEVDAGAVNNEAYA